jgi:hypothetical protein
MAKNQIIFRIILLGIWLLVGSLYVHLTRGKKWNHPTVMVLNILVFGMFLVSGFLWTFAMKYLNITF